MKMTGLQVLHRNMIAIQVDMQQFRVTTGAASFDCLFSTRDSPNFTLSLTSRGINPKFFIFQVLPGYWIKPFFDEFYFELVSVLKTDANSHQKLIPKDFLSQLNSAIPTIANVSNVPKPNEIIRLRPDISEERDKPFFDTWIYWKKESGKGPTQENRYKTKLLLGTQALEYSVKNNASSKWSAIDLDRI